jgi:hypothetical protein
MAMVSKHCLVVNAHTHASRAPHKPRCHEYAHAGRYLRFAKAAGTPFYVGVGFRKPHLPWRHPVSFWDLYEGKTLTTAKHQTIGKNITTLVGCAD